MKKIISLLLTITLLLSTMVAFASETVLLDEAFSDVSSLAKGSTFGDWAVENEALVQKSNDKYTEASYGDNSWVNYSASFSFLTENIGEGSVGAVLFDNGETFIKIYFDKGGFRFNTGINSEEKTLKWRILELSDGVYHNVAINIIDNAINISLDEELLYQYPVDSSLNGTFKLFTENTSATFDNLKITGTRKSKAFFSDIENHWAKNEISLLAACKIVNGVDENNFAPEKLISRAEFIAIASRTIINQFPEYNNEFNDVSANDWYAKTLAWAKQNNIIDENMIVNGNVLPNQPITREEMTAVLIKTGNFARKQFFSDEITVFTDNGDIADWAKDYVKKAYGSGLVNGMTETTFEPKGNATRAQAAVILCRYWLFN